jgi:nucleotide-binding universal stress UspA family protein
VTLMVALGDVTEAQIIAFKDSDLLVLGSRGRGGLGGSESVRFRQECVALASCPVVIVRRPE